MTSTQSELQLFHRQSDVFGGIVSMVKGYLVGDFDLFNVAHLDVIGQALQKCDELTIGVLSDEDFEITYGRLPVVPLDERCEIVRNVRGVSAVTVFSGWTDHSCYAVLFHDLRSDAADSTSFAAPGSITRLELSRGTESEILRGHLSGRGGIAEAS